MSRESRRQHRRSSALPAIFVVLARDRRERGGTRRRAPGEHAGADAELTNTDTYQTYGTRRYFTRAI